jgi:glutamate racemase
LNRNAPIGIFDSGIGGLTVAHAIRESLPYESFVYFGDTAHLPYGDKSPAAIRHYAARITGFLLSQGAKIIVIACNTASAHAYQTVLDICGPQVPVVNVIDPVVNRILSRHAKGKIGVIGTKGTIASRIYPRKIEGANPELKVASRATPLLASMIEEGYFNNRISETIIHNYLNYNALKDLDALILGCTHYPLIRREVESFYRSKNVDIVDSGECVAEEVKGLLKAKKLNASEGSLVSSVFYVSDRTAAFENSTRTFFGEKIKLIEARIWE